METAYSNLNSIDIALWIWFALTAVSVAFVAWDLLTRTPEMKVMKWGWIPITLCAGIFENRDTFRYAPTVTEFQNDD